MKILLQELHLVSELSPKGSHTRVAQKNKISKMYLWQIRKGKNMLTDTTENRKTMRKIITSYRLEISKYERKLAEIKKEIRENKKSLI